MAENRVMIACRESAVFWADGGDPLCVDVDHQHARHEVHRHLDAVVLAEGVHVVAASYEMMDPYARSVVPDFGLYLDAGWQPPWRHDHLDWPDFGVPDDHETLRRALVDVLARARAGQRVEIGCLGGHGRTGTALACLAILAGEDPASAAARIRADYCPQAIETDDQLRLVNSFVA